MSLESARAFLAERAPELVVVVHQQSTATVALAAEAFGVEPGRIAKTLALRAGDQALLIVAAGLARLDNRKFKDAFGGAKPRMLDHDATFALTGHPVGGVCPFGLATPLPVVCDLSLKAFDEVVPAAGAPNTGVRIAPDRLAEIVDARWLDVCA